MRDLTHPVDGIPVAARDRAGGDTNEQWNKTLARVEAYFDGAATRAWDQLTSDAPVSRIRQSVRRGRAAMQRLILSHLPADLTGMRILDAGCGTGQMTQALAMRGAEVVAVDISPSLVEIARRRLPEHLSRHVSFRADDMLRADLGQFDHCVAMDSLLYYDCTQLARAVTLLGGRTSGRLLFTVAPRTPLLMAMWQIGRLFPRSDRAPGMVPQCPSNLAGVLSHQCANGTLRTHERVAAGFYISQALEYSE